MRVFWPLAALALAACSDENQALPTTAFDGGVMTDAGPADVSTPIASLSARNEVCIARQRGTVACSSAGEVPDLIDAVEVAAGAAHACALREGGKVVCWGNNDEGQLGRDGPAQTRPVEVQGLGPIRRIAAGTGETCGLDETGAVLCWGHVLGAPAGTFDPVPRRADLPEPAVDLALGWGFGCAILDSGAVRCWGEGAAVDPTPAGAPDVGRAVALSAGATHACALIEDGTIACWGALDLATPVIEPARLRPASTVRDFSAGYGATCVLADGVFCFGQNTYHAFQTDQERASIEEPVSPPALQDAVKVAVGHVFTCVATRSGRVECTGYDVVGEDGQPGFEGLHFNR
ncbi:MAG: hypothetical protein IT384_03255 [Deltaproteobacteria bacterium]|nr:hypothetical protein [Deltaproteobacteria bacterium]